MIPSFHPVRERLNSDAYALATAGLTADQLKLASAGSTPMVNPNSGLTIKSSDDLLASSRLVRYPDNPALSYPDLLAAELQNSTQSPFTADGRALWTANGMVPPKVAVIGGGLSGLMCAWQLRKLGAVVDLFETSPAPNGNAASPQGAGRISSVNVNPSDTNTRGEFGAMRFPDTSYMFWHYMRLMVPSATSFTEFPNPSKVPSLLSGEQQLSAYWTNGGIGINAAADNGYNLNSLQTRHLNAFLNVSDGTYPLSQVSTWMTDGAAADPLVVAKVKYFWRTLVQRYYRTSYLQFLQQSGFSAAEIDIIGYLGLGTGGFKPLFDTCVLELMRLFVWDYAAEYAVPDLYQLPFGLMNAVSASGGSLYYNTRVNYVLYSRTWKKCVLYYQPSNGGGGPWFSGQYHYVIGAMTHKALSSLLQAAPAAAPPGAATYAPDPVFPFGAASMPNARSAFYADVRNQQGMSSIKIFQTIGGPATPAPASDGPFTSVTPAPGSPAANANYGRYARVVLGKPGTSSSGAPLGVTYMLPYGAQEFPNCQMVTGLQYAWGSDAITLRNGLLAAAANINGALNTAGKFVGNERNSAFVANLYGALVSRVQGKVQTPGVVNYGNSHSAYFAPYRANGVPGGEGYVAIVDWDRVPHVNMAFKLDAPGRGSPSIYRFVHQALKHPDSTLLPAGSWDNGVVSDPSVKGLYFCGDSFSNYGGWAEGAFQSAMNVVASIAYDSSNAWGQLSRLSVGARALIETAPAAFDPTVYPSGPTYS